MLRVGAHMSIAGGVSRAIDRAFVHGCEALQIFTKNASQWRGAPLDPAEVKAFRTRIEQTDIRPAVSHASYLINLATTFPALREQSLAAFADELDRAHALGLLGVVVHPGTCTAGTEDEGLRLIGDAIRLIPLSDTRFAGSDGLSFDFDPSGNPAAFMVERHVSGDWRYTRQPPK